MKVEYSSLNSGGEWWLTDRHWEALEDDGWVVQWGHQNWCSTHNEHNICEDLRLPCPGHGLVGSLAEVSEKERWLEAAAVSAILDGVRSVEEAISRWDDAIGFNANEEGCRCCGQPHNFSEVYDPDWRDDFFPV